MSTMIDSIEPLIAMSTAMTNYNTQTSIGVAVLKQTMDMAASQSQDLISMMSGTTVPVDPSLGSFDVSV